MEIHIVQLYLKKNNCSFFLSLVLVTHRCLLYDTLELQSFWGKQYTTSFISVYKCYLGEMCLYLLDKLQIISTKYDPQQ